MKALIIGATGATGKDIVDVLLKDGDYSEVVLFVRRSSGVTHPKLVEIITDFDRLAEVGGSINGDIWFSCLGTTLKTAGSKDKQRHIDFGIPAKFADIAKKNDVSRAVLLSSYGASSKSNVFYSRIKGELEDHLESLAFEQLIIFRPGLLLRKDSDRMGERVTAAILKLLNALGLARKFKPLPTSILAEKLAKATKMSGPGRHVIELDKIFRL